VKEEEEKKTEKKGKYTNKQTTTRNQQTPLQIQRLHKTHIQKKKKKLHAGWGLGEEM